MKRYWYTIYNYDTETKGSLVRSAIVSDENLNLYNMKVFKDFQDKITKEHGFKNCVITFFVEMYLSESNVLVYSNDICDYCIKQKDCNLITKRSNCFKGNKLKTI